MCKENIEEMGELVFIQIKGADKWDDYNWPMTDMLEDGDKDLEDMKELVRVEIDKKAEEYKIQMIKFVDKVNKDGLPENSIETLKFYEEYFDAANDWHDVSEKCELRYAAFYLRALVNDFEELCAAKSKIDITETFTIGFDSVINKNNIY